MAPLALMKLFRPCKSRFAANAKLALLRSFSCVCDALLDGRVPRKIFKIALMDPFFISYEKLSTGS